MQQQELHTFLGPSWTSTFKIQGGSNMTGTDLCVNKSQFVPVIFEPPCILKVYIRLVNESPLAKYLSLMRNLIHTGIALRYFVSFLWILEPIFWTRISETIFVILTKFLNPEPSSTLNRRRRLFPCWTLLLNKRRFQNFSHILAVSFFSLKYISRTHSSCNFTPRHGLTYRTGQVGVDTALDSYEKAPKAI